MGLVLGICSALIWGVAGVTAGLGSRMVGPFRMITWGLVLGMALAVPLAVLSGAPGHIDLRVAIWIVVVAAGMLSGMVFVNAGMRRGSISVVAPISALYGGFSALLSIVLGEPVTALAIASLIIAVLGGVLAASGQTAAPGAQYSNQRAAAGFAALAAVVWGIQLYAGGQIEVELGPSWLVLIARSLGLIVLVAVLLPRGALRVPRKVLPYALVTGCGEVAGFTLYLHASNYGIAEASVLTGQYGTVAALIGLVVLKERLRGIQYVGLAMIVIAVVGLSIA
ncbi:MAG: EamA family transporter [Gaiellales bacterium]